MTLPPPVPPDRPARAVLSPRFVKGVAMFIALFLVACLGALAVAVLVWFVDLIT